MKRRKYRKLGNCNRNTKNKLAEYIESNKEINYRGMKKVGGKRLYDFKTLGEGCLYVKKYRKQ